MNKAEYDALDSEHLSSEAFKLYAKCIRRHMDYESGLTGKKRKVSYQMFKEQLEIRRKRGSKLEDFIPSKKQLRGYVDELVEVGLIEKLPTQRTTDPMIFRCVLASTGSIRLNEEGHRKGTEDGHELNLPKNKEKQSLNDVLQCNEGRMKGTQHGHTSVTSVITTTSTREDLRKFPMHTEWEPSQNFHALCRRSKINPDELSVHRCLGPFISHFLAKPGQHGSQAAWDSAFVKWVARERSTSNSPPKAYQPSSVQTKRSAVSAAVMDINDTDW